VLELAVLGLLKEQPLHGYELKKRLAETVGSVWGVSFGSLYPALRRLERAGAIEVVEGSGRRGGGGAPMPATGSLAGEAAAARLRVVPATPSRRNRKAYRITPAGEAQLVELLTANDGPDDERSFTVRLAFCRYLDAPARLDLLERRRAELRDRLQRATRPRGAALDRYTRSLAEHRIRSTERDLEWVEDLIDQERTTDRPPGGTATPPSSGTPLSEGASA
jgi:DNA-binding PadR family transcriptional regulator